MKRKHRLSHIGRRKPPGTVPGQVIAPVDAANPVISVIAYGAEEITEKSNVSLGELQELRGRFPVIWVDVSNLGDAELILKLGDIFGLHHLALEDVVNTHQRPKVEEYEGHLFIVARMLNHNSVAGTEQISMFLGNGFLITFQSIVGDCFEPVRQRLRGARGRVRARKADYLCYALLDAIVDTYFPELERYGDLLEDLEASVLGNPDRSNVKRLHEAKRELLMLRRAIWPHREMINAIIRDECKLIEKDTRVFLRDCYDHTVQLMDIVETYRELASGLVDVYVSNVSAKLNEVMKVLTIISTIFMPLSFIASLYGMNFDRSVSPWNMPELGWRYGYLFSLGLMAVSVAALMFLFYWNGWLNGRRKKDQT